MASAFCYIRRERASVWEPPPPPVRRLTPRSPSPAGRLLCASVFAYLSAMIIAFLSVLLNFTVRLPEAKPPRWGGGPRSVLARGRWWGFPYGRSFTSYITERRSHIDFCILFVLFFANFAARSSLFYLIFTLGEMELAVGGDLFGGLGF